MDQVYALARHIIACCTGYFARLYSVRRRSQQSTVAQSIQIIESPSLSLFCAAPIRMRYALINLHRIILLVYTRCAAIVSRCNSFVRARGKNVSAWVGNRRFEWWTSARELWVCPEKWLRETLVVGNYCRLFIIVWYDNVIFVNLTRCSDQLTELPVDSLTVNTGVNSINPM